MRDPGPILIDSLDKPNASPQGPGQPHPHAPISRRDEPRTRLPAQAWLILTLLAVGLTAFMLWGIASALQAALWEWPWLGWAFGLLLLLVAATSLVALGYSLVMWLFYRTQRSRIIRTAFDTPVDSMQVLNRDPLAMEAPRLAYETAKIAAMEHPLITTWTSPQQPQAKVEAPALLAAPDDLAPVSLATVSGWIDELPHVMFAAKTGKGKTATCLHLLKPRAEAGEQFCIIDPHSGDWGGLPVLGGGEDWQAIAHVLTCLLDEYQARLNERERHKAATGRELPHDHFDRMTIIFDEAWLARKNLDIAPKRGEITIWEKFVPVMGSGARKVSMNLWPIVQTANVGDLGLSGPARENFLRIPLDTRACRIFVQQEETNAARRAKLLDLLDNEEWPALVEHHGRIHRVDRSAAATMPDLTRYADQVWQPTQPTLRQPTPMITIDEILIRAVRAGKTRDETRVTLQQRGLGFRDQQWTDARSFVLSERLTSADAA